MNEMLERCARAARAGFYKRDNDIDSDPATYDICTPATKEMWRDAVRATLEAIREPTKAMLLRGVTPRGAQHEDAARVCWQAMIDDVLREKPAGET